MRQPKQYFMDNLLALSSLELRTLNRFYLHPENRRCCSKCRKIYEDYRNHFHIKKYYPDGSVGYNVECSNCKNAYHATLRDKKRTCYKESIRTRTAQIRNRASKNNLPFNLSTEYLIELWEGQKGLCYYTKEILDFQYTTDTGVNAHKLAPSLDKLVPELGYVMGNVVWCLNVINTMKNNFDSTMFIQICNRISDLHRKD